MGKQTTKIVAWICLTNVKKRDLIKLCKKMTTDVEKRPRDRRVWKCDGERILVRCHCAPGCNQTSRRSSGSRAASGSAIGRTGAGRGLRNVFNAEDSTNFSGSQVSDNHVAASSGRT